MLPTTMAVKLPYLSVCVMAGPWCRVFAMGPYRLAGMCANKWLAAEKRGTTGDFSLVIQATGLGNMSTMHLRGKSKATNQPINTQNSLNLLQRFGYGRNQQWQKSHAYTHAAFRRIRKVSPEHSLATQPTAELRKCLADVENSVTRRPCFRFDIDNLPVT
ncbi:hypothetical protein GGR51DRAFT_522553 [Nemania sp. FL0031]|nr:hypothetical protein GGR51DRAFT_522553 [Nemania sp. FL0031]